MNRKMSTAETNVAVLIVLWGNLSIIKYTTVRGGKNQNVFLTFV